MSSASSGPCDNPEAGSDSDIMSEVVRVMSSELKRARVEQDRLCEEKERLQQELNDAHTQLCVMKKAQEQQSERLGGDSNAKRYEKALRKIDRLVQERDENKANYEKSLEEMTEKLTKVHDKYKNSKASLREARTELDRLRAATAVDVSKVPETGESHSLKRKARTEDGETPARLDSRHVTELPMPAEKQLQTLTVSYEKDLANIRQFLVISPGETLKEPSLQHCQMLRGKQNWEALITKLRSVHLDRTMKYCVEDSIIWCPSSSMRCLFVHPVHCYQPETHTFRPFDYNGFIKPGETRELCLSKGDTSFYCGTFRCAEASHLRTEDLIQLGVANQDRLFGYLVTRVMTLGSSVPPAGGASRSRLLRNAYLDGTILVRCHSMEYIGRNSTVSTFFVRCAGDGSAPGQPVANLTHNAGERHKRAKIEIP